MSHSTRWRCLTNFSYIGLRDLRPTPYGRTNFLLSFHPFLKLSRHRLSLPLSFRILFLSPNPAGNASTTISVHGRNHPSLSLSQLILMEVQMSGALGCNRARRGFDVYRGIRRPTRRIHPRIDRRGGCGEQAHGPLLNRWGKNRLTEGWTRVNHVNGAQIE